MIFRQHYRNRRQFIETELVLTRFLIVTIRMSHSLEGRSSSVGSCQFSQLSLIKILRRPQISKRGNYGVSAPITSPTPSSPEVDPLLWFSVDFGNFRYYRAMIAFRGIAPGADKGFQCALLMFFSSNRRRAQIRGNSHRPACCCCLLKQISGIVTSIASLFDLKKDIIFQAEI